MIYPTLWTHKYRQLCDMADIIITLAIFSSRHSEPYKYPQLFAMANIVITLVAIHYKVKQFGIDKLLCFFLRRVGTLLQILKKVWRESEQSLNITDNSEKVWSESEHYWKLWTDSEQSLNITENSEHCLNILNIAFFKSKDIHTISIWNRCSVRLYHLRTSSI